MFGVRRGSLEFRGVYQIFDELYNAAIIYKQCIFYDDYLHEVYTKELKRHVPRFGFRFRQDFIWI